MLGGKEARAVRLMNAFGAEAEHVVLSAVPDALTAREAIDPGIKVEFPGEAAPPLRGRPGLHRYAGLAAYLDGFDLVLSYNWGAMDAVAARRLHGATRRLPPLIHHEDGFNEDEAVRQKPARVWYRRLMLSTAEKLVVPSRQLETIARTIWKQPGGRIERIPNGIAIPGDADLASPLPLPVSAGGGLIIGTVAGLRPVKNLPRLVRIFARGAPADARLVILGEGPERAAIIAEAERLGVAGRMTLPGFVRDPVRYMAGFDIFALSSDSEQFPISLVEAMACGLPGLVTDVGDTAAMVAAENRPFVLPKSDESELAAALARLAADPALRRAIGTANRAIALRDFSEQAMLDRYHNLYWCVMADRLRR